MEFAPPPVCYRHPDRPTRIVCQRCNRPICPECMVPGAVGFQCPECVSQGFQQTRQLDLPYGGARSRDPRITSFVLIGINVLVWLGVMATGGTFGRLYDLLNIVPRGYCLVGSNQISLVGKAQCVGSGVHWVDGVATGSWWQLITSAFTHAEPMHIGFNMLALYFLGPQLEQVFGRARFLAMYLVSALVASAFVMWLAEPYVSTVGASGAIFGLMAAILLVVHKHHGNLRTILFWLGANVAMTVFGSSVISWQGHLGGFVGGLAVTAAILYVPKDRRRPWQWVLIGAVAVVAVVLSIARGVILAG